MNFENLDIVKVSSINYKLYQLVDYKRENINISINNITSPFGLEKYQHMYYINWLITSDISTDIIKEYESYIMNLIINSNNKYKKWSWLSCIRTKSGYLPLLKTRINYSKNYNNLQDPSNNNFIIDSCISLETIIASLTVNIILVCDSIWFDEKNNTFGILWILSNISKN